jgi:hypothetical protein
MKEQPQSRFDLVRDQPYVPAALPQGKSAHFHLAVSCLGLRTGLEVSEKRKIY